MYLHVRVDNAVHNVAKLSRIVTGNTGQIPWQIFICLSWTSHHFQRQKRRRFSCEARVGRSFPARARCHRT